MFRSLYRLLLSRNKTSQKKKGLRFQPQLAHLEDRITPATINVNTTADLNGPNPFNTPVLVPPSSTISLRRAIDQVNFGPDLSYTVNLPSGFYATTLGGAGENLNQTGDFDLFPLNATSVTFVGAGPNNTIIDANGLDRLFHIMPQGFLTVTFQNLTLSGGAIGSLSSPSDPGVGGGIYLDDGGNPTSPVTPPTGITLPSPFIGIGQTRIVLDNAFLLYNQAQSDGGGIYALKGSVNLLNGSSVGFNNSGGSGGGIYLGGGDLLVSGSNISRNVAYGSGGGVYAGNLNPAASIQITSSGGATPVPSNIDRNTAGGHGGGIFDNHPFGVFSLFGSNVTNNVAGGSSSGGGLYLNDHEMTIQAALFNNNQAGVNGGALNMYASSGGDSIEIIDTIWTNNHVDGDGGAFYNSGSHTVNIYSTSSSNNSLFRNNTAGDDGGAIFDSGATTFRVINTQFITNTAGHRGGAVALMNSASGVSFGGAIFSGNVADNQGGAVYHPAGIRLDIVSSGLNGNVGGDGGGVYTGAQIINVNNSDFVDNHSTAAGGGGLKNSSASTSLLNVTDTIFDQNFAGGSGGGLYTNAQVATISDFSSFTYNRAASSSSSSLGGGGLAFGGGALLVNQSSFNFNVSTTGGGGLGAYLSSSGVVNIQASTVSQNQAAGTGGGIEVRVGSSSYSSGGGSLNVANSTVSSNQTAQSGGGIYTTAQANFLNQDSILGNMATTGGGGVHFDSNGSSDVAQTMTVTASLLAFNRAGGAGSGGGILADANQAIISMPSPSTQNSLLRVINSTIDSNTAGQNGGGIANQGSTDAQLPFATVSSNLATQGGGLWNDVDMTQSIPNIVASTPKTFLANSIVALNQSSPGPFNIDANVMAATQNFNGMDLHGRFANLYVPPAFLESPSQILSDPSVLSMPLNPQIVGHNLIGIGGLGAGQYGIFDTNEPSGPTPNGNKVGSYSSPIDPLLGPLVISPGSPTATRALLVGSPAIAMGQVDAAIQALAPYDQRGFPHLHPLTNLLVSPFVRSDVGAYQTP